MSRNGVAIDVRVEESLHLELPRDDGIGFERVTITVEHKSGQVARLRIKAGDVVRIRHPRQKTPEPIG